MQLLGNLPGLICLVVVAGSVVLLDELFCWGWGSGSAGVETGVSGGGSWGGFGVP